MKEDDATISTEISKYRTKVEKMGEIIFSSSTFKKRKKKKRGEYWIRKTKKNFFFLVMHSTSISEFVPREKKI